MIWLIIIIHLADNIVCQSHTSHLLYVINADSTLHKNMVSNIFPIDVYKILSKFLCYAVDQKELNFCHSCVFLFSFSLTRWWWEKKLITFLLGSGNQPKYDAVTRSYALETRGIHTHTHPLNTLSSSTTWHAQRIESNKIVEKLGAAEFLAFAWRSNSKQRKKNWAISQIRPSIEQPMLQHSRCLYMRRKER